MTEAEGAKYILGILKKKKCKFRLIHKEFPYLLKFRKDEHRERVLNILMHHSCDLKYCGYGYGPAGIVILGGYDNLSDSAAAILGKEWNRVDEENESITPEDVAKWQIKLIKKHQYKFKRIRKKLPIILEFKNLDDTWGAWKILADNNNKRIKIAVEDTKIVLDKFYE